MDNALKHIATRVAYFEKLKMVEFKISQPGYKLKDLELVNESVERQLSHQVEIKI